MVICEVQQYSDLTYRVYDYGRTDVNGKPRELHMEKALEVLTFNSSAPTKSPTTSAQFTDGKKFSEELVACPYFRVTRFDIQERAHLSMRPADRFKLWVFLEGQGKSAGLLRDIRRLEDAIQGSFPISRESAGSFPLNSGATAIIPRKQQAFLSPLLEMANWDLSTNIPETSVATR